MFPYKLTPLADKEKLLDAYKGKKKSDLPTPALIVDRSIYKVNCEKMLENCEKLNASFRAHVKTHKTLEGTRLQLGSNSITTDRIVVSTLIEAWNLLPLVKQGLLNDILFSLPVVKSRLPELVKLSNEIPNLRLMLDNYEQLQVLSEFNKSNNIDKKWSIFFKVNLGTDRAGLKLDDDDLDEIINALFNDHSISSNVSLYGFYCHAGHAYKSCTCDQAKSYLIDEITQGNLACQKAMQISNDPSLDLVISVGSTPTAHASEILEITKLGKLSGELELHAGNYPFNDLQQLGTKCIDKNQISCKILAEVVSSYPKRGEKLPGEELINAGVIALARESGPIPGFGLIASPQGYENWMVGRLSQEHGILTPIESNENTKMIPLGTKVEIIPQHSCISAASYPWYYIFDGDDTVADIWVPFRGW